jgi:multisubunit Na+/H+ antiporter MnhE subunit
LAGICAAIVAWFTPDVVKQNFNHPQFWYALIGILLTGITALTVSVFNYAKRINPKTHLL